ncbi:MAG TPA: hypothetical protein VIK35_04925 [Verrucomicrobiae bacterium]
MNTADFNYDEAKNGYAGWQSLARKTRSLPGAQCLSENDIAAEIKDYRDADSIGRTPNPVLQERQRRR